MELDKAVAKVIQRVRKEREFTQRELGYRTGLDPMTISRIERGERLPSLVTLFMLAKALGYSVSEWIEEIERMSPDIQIAEGDMLNYRPRPRGKKGANQLFPGTDSTVPRQPTKYKRERRKD